MLSLLSKLLVLNIETYGNQTVRDYNSILSPYSKIICFDTIYTFQKILYRNIALKILQDFLRKVRFLYVFLENTWKDGTPPGYKGAQRTAMYDAMQSANVE
jgi:hypothetical protein